MSNAQQGATDPLEFRAFWTYIAQQLGNSRLRINPKAKTIRDFIAPTNDAKEYLKASIRESYKRCGCSHLGSKLCMNSVLDILGETAFALRNNHQDDLFDIELLEEIAWYINDQYFYSLSIKSFDHKESQAGQVVSFPNYKIRIANSRL